MYPDHLKTQYWEEVASLIRQNPDAVGRSYDERAVRDAIAKFRDRLAPHETGDLIYHQDAKKTADAVRTNFLTAPVKSRPGRAPAKHEA